MRSFCLWDQLQAYFGSEDVDAKLAELKKQGVKYELSHCFVGSHAYIDMADAPGVMIQLMPHDESHIIMFDIIKDAADTWDGKTNPIRPPS